MHDPTGKFQGSLTPERERLAKIISLIEQPPFLSIPVFILICMLKTNDLEDGLIFSAIAIITTTIIPLALIVYFSKRYGNDDRLDVVRKEDRFLPMIFGIMGYSLGFGLLWYLGAPDLATVLMLCYAVVTTAMMLITFFWKISVHSCGVVGPSMALSVGFWPYGLLYFLLLPPVIWSRYVLRKHTPLQLAMGAIVGGSITAIIFCMML